MRDQEWNASLAQLHSLDLAKLVLRLFLGDAVDSESSLGVVDKAEVLACLFDSDHVHKAGWVCWVGSYFAINLDEALHDDGLGLASIEGVLQSRDVSVVCSWLQEESVAPVANENDQGHAVSQLVRTWRCLWRIGTTELVEQPMLWR